MQAARGASLTSDHDDTGNPQDPRPQSRVPALAAIAAVALVLDQVTKVLAVHYLDGRDAVPVLGPVLRLTLARNPGAAFSTGTGFTSAIAVFAMVAVVVTCWFAARVRTTGYAWGIGLVLAGIGGNLVDRLVREPGPLRGHVIDFLQLPHWPVFNVADICINVGAVLIVLQVFRGVHLDGSREQR